MNKKTLRGVPKKAAAIPKSEERIRLEERRKFADELMIEIRREYEKSLAVQSCALANSQTALIDLCNRKMDIFKWVMNLICGKVYEK